MAEEASKLRGLEARVAALETKFNFLLQFIRRWTEREEEKKKATISKRQKEIYPALSLSKAAQTLPTPRRPAFHIPRPSRTEPRQFQPLPIPVPQLYTLLIKKKMITPVNQRTRIGPQPKDYNKDLTCEYHQGEVGHTVENCRVLRHRIQDLLDQGVSEGYSPAPRAPKESTEAGTCQYHPGARDHNLQGCEEFKKEVAGLITKGLIRRRGEQPERDCMTIDQLRLSPYEKTNFQARMERIEEDFEKFCERKKEELGKLTPATPLEISKPDPVVIRYATKEKVMLQTASVSAVQSSEKVPSVVIQVPQPFPYQDSKRIPWNYGMKVISTRENKPKTKEEVVGNLTSGLGGITRSGRCYTPEELEKRRKETGKAVEDPISSESSRVRISRASIPYFTGRKRTRNERSYGQNCEKTVRTLSQILVSVVDKTAYLGGNVCAKILSDPLQLGPRAKTLRQEVHFSYHMQLSDRQELLRSSRNLSQKMTPWHKEHSDGLCSQDHILRTQARLCARPSLPDSQQVDLRARAHWKEGHIHARRGTLGSPRIYRGQPESRSENCPQTDQKHPGGLCSRGHISQVQARIPANPEPCKNRQRKLSDGTKNVKIRHRELGQICARTGTRFEKKRAGSKTHFFSRTAAFARRVFPARNKLIREPGCVGKIMTPATSWNSRFADSIPRLTGIFASEECTKTAPTPRLPGAITPSSELRFAQTLYRWKEDVESFPTICRMTHFEFQEDLQNCPRKSDKKGYAHGNRGGFEEAAGVEG
uniref:Uncharacterized protein n=1 Tax=Fagus sylvatica TaxID=28930 RepID=A0A2N9EWE8_FAGSY